MKNANHVKVWWNNQHFWVMIGMAIFVVVSGKGVFNVSGSDMIALAAVVVSYLIFDIWRDIRRAST